MDQGSLRKSDNAGHIDGWRSETQLLTCECVTSALRLTCRLLHHSFTSLPPFYPFTSRTLLAALWSCFHSFPSSLRQRPHPRPLRIPWIRRSIRSSPLATRLLCNPPSRSLTIHRLFLSLYLQPGFGHFLADLTPRIHSPFACEDQPSLHPHLSRLSRTICDGLQTIPDTSSIRSTIDDTVGRRGERDRTASTWTHKEVCTLPRTSDDNGRVERAVQLKLTSDRNVMLELTLFNRLILVLS